MVEGIQINQGIELTQQVSYRYANRRILPGIQHHHFYKPFILDLSFKLSPQYISVDTGKKLADIQFQRVAIRIT